MKETAHLTVKQVHTKNSFLEIGIAILITVLITIIISGVCTYALGQANGYFANQAIANRANYAAVIAWRGAVYFLRKHYNSKAQTIYQLVILGICLLTVVLLIYTN